MRQLLSLAFLACLVSGCYTMIRHPDLEETAVEEGLEPGPEPGPRQERLGLEEEEPAVGREDGPPYDVVGVGVASVAALGDHPPHQVEPLGAIEPHDRRRAPPHPAMQDVHLEQGEERGGVVLDARPPATTGQEGFNSGGRARWLRYKVKPVTTGMWGTSAPITTTRLQPSPNNSSKIRSIRSWRDEPV